MLFWRFPSPVCARRICLSWRKHYHIAIVLYNKKPGPKLRVCFLWLVEVVFVLELFNTTAAVDHLRCAGEERMACWAYVESQFFFGWFCNESVTTCASYFTFLVIRMDSFLHVRLCLSCRAYNLPTYFRISPQKLLQPLYYTTSPRRKQAEFSQNRFRQYAALHHTGSSHAENAGRISSILALPIPYRFARQVIYIFFVNDSKHFRFILASLST